MATRKTTRLIRSTPMYQQLADLLREEVRSGGFPDGRIPSERQLSKRYKVSGNVASWAVEVLVKEGLLYRVHRRGTFVADSVLSGGNSARPVVYTTVGPGREQMLDRGGLYARMVYMLRENAERDGYELVAHPLAEKDSWRFKTLTASPFFAGAVAFHHGFARDYLGNIIGETPVVVVDHCIDLLDDNAPLHNVSYVATDNERAADEATRYLISKGHRKIIFFGGDLGVSAGNYPTYRERVGGYRRAMKEAGLSYAPGPYRFDNALDEAYWKMQASGGVTAAIAYNDYSAVLAMNLIHRVGLKVPDDISLVCFDDLMQQLVDAVPRITAMAMPVREMVNLAWKLIAESSEHAGATMTRLPYTLSRRDSVAQL